MAPPDTDLEKQERRHKAPLGGIVAAMIFAAVLLVGLLTYLAYRGNEPSEPAQQIDGRTGEEEQVE